MLPTRNNDTIMELDGRIEKFIGKHNVLTLATATEEGAPYCCNLFYAYEKDERRSYSRRVPTRAMRECWRATL